jgi:hypothetical protein
VLLPQLCRQQHPHVLAGDFRRQISGHAFGGSAELLNNAMLVAHDDRVDRGLEDCPISALAFHQLLLEGRSLASLAATICSEKYGKPEAEHQPSE